MLSTCSFYHYSPVQNLITPTHSMSEAEKAVPSNLPLSSIATPTITTTLPSAAAEKLLVDDRAAKEQKKEKRPSSCWIDFTNHNSGRDSKTKLGKWSAHTWRRYPSVLSQIDIGKGGKNASVWRRLLHDGIFIGINDVGFRLKFLPE